MTLEGRQLGRYRIVRRLGIGGMGEVWLGEDARIQQQVAIKVIRAEQSPYPNAPNAQTAIRLFQREARAIVALDHPHILPLHDYGEEPQGNAVLIYLVMPYRPEGSLVNWVQQHYPDRLVPPAVVAHGVSQAAEALQHAHDHQIIHQDVKPSNFLIRANPKDPARPDLLLADFGIARIASATASTSQSIRGTPAYMAPEQCEGEAFPASDQYALAVMAYELLTGRPPFQGNAMRLMYQHVHTKPEPPSARNARLSGAVDEVLLTALSKRPEERFGSVAAFANAFWYAVEAMSMADAPTRISAETTSVPPAAPLISNTMAAAITKITPPTKENAAPSAGLIAEASAPPDAQGWTAASTGPTVLPLPETVDLGKRRKNSALTPSPARGWRDEAGAPTTPPLPATLSLQAADAAGAFAKDAKRVSKPVPAPSAPLVARRRAGKRRLILITAAALVILALVAGGGAYTIFGASATVTITPTSKDVSNTYPITAVTGTPDASKQQVQARMLSTTTSKQIKTAAATGQGTIPGTGTHATGMLTFFSCDPINTLNLPVGTTLPNNGGDPAYSFIEVVLDAAVILAPFTCGTSYPPTVSVSAHVLQVGTVGNHSYPFFAATPLSGGVWFAYDSAKCGAADCYGAEDTSAFMGGQDPQTYAEVQQSDIDNAAIALISANKPNAQDVLQPQIKPNEQLVGTSQCQPNVTVDHNAGDQATTVTVNVTFTCTGEAYDHTAAVSLVANLLTQQAAKDPGAGYVEEGKPKVVLLSATPVTGAQGAYTLAFLAEGTWAYQLSAAQQQALARLIAGKSKAQAQHIVTTQPGVAAVTITLSGGLGQTLPSDPTKIKIVTR